MSCCGQKRRAWREWPARNTQPAAPEAPALQNPARLYHLGDTSLLVNGPVTGITYLFGGRGTSLAIDERDVEALLTMRVFSMSEASGKMKGA